MVSVKNLIVKDGNHSASRHGFLRLCRVLPTSQALTRKPFFIHNVAPRNEHVSIIFGVNRSEASFFTIKFFNFQVHFPCK